MRVSTLNNNVSQNLSYSDFIRNTEGELVAVVIEKKNVTITYNTQAANSKFEISEYKDIFILLLVSSFAGFLGGLFGTAGTKNFIFSTSFSFHKLSSKQLTLFFNIIYYILVRTTVHVSLFLHFCLNLFFITWLLATNIASYYTP